MKTEAQYKEEFNQLVGGAIAGLKRAAYVRKQISKVSGKKFHTEGATFGAVTAAIKALGSVKTYKGSGELNPGKK
jgi:hypothetical protein